MNIGIVGMGYVGRAVQASWLGSQHKVKYYDPAVDGSVSDLQELVSGNPSAIFICVPTPSIDTGECDLSIIITTLDQIKTTYSGMIVIKSTVPPDFWQAYIAHDNIFHVPEFLVASRAIQDYLNPEFIFIGGNKSQTHKVSQLLASSAVNTAVPIYYTDLITASLVKYFMNTFLATKVTVLNQFSQLSNAIGANWDDFTQMIEIDNRMGSSHTQVPGPDGKYGYGGACFPKDVRAIIHSMQKHNVSAGIIEAVDAANTQFRGKE